MKNFLIPLLIAGSLASCAPSIQASASAPTQQATTPLFVDPVLATGQVWQAMWPSGVTENITVPQRNTKIKTGSSYEGREELTLAALTTHTNFTYQPAGEESELILLGKIVFYKNSLFNTLVCVVRNPSPVEIGKSLKGAYSTSPDKEIEAYVKTGVTTLPPCYLKRLK